MTNNASSAWHVRRYVAEFIGTCALVVFGVGSSMVAEKTHAFGIGGIALAFGLIVAIIIVAIGKISGAHINPAFTIAMWSQRHFHGRDVIPYVVSQCAGAIAGSLLLLRVFGSMGTVGVTLPIIGAPFTLLIEALYSAVLAFVSFHVSAESRIPRRITPWIVGFTVFVGARITGPVTGGSFNPARSLGPALVSGHMEFNWVYWIAPVLGMWVGAAMQKTLHRNPTREQD